MDAWAFGTHFPIKNPQYSWVQHEFNRTFNFYQAHGLTKMLGDQHPSEALMRLMIEATSNTEGNPFTFKWLINQPGFPWSK